MDQISESNELMACLSRCVNSFPLKDLYKCVEYENLEKYYEAKAERTKRQKKITSEYEQHLKALLPERILLITCITNSQSQYDLGIQSIMFMIMSKIFFHVTSLADYFVDK